MARWANPPGGGQARLLSLGETGSAAREGAGVRRHAIGASLSFSPSRGFGIGVICQRGR